MSENSQQPNFIDRVGKLAIYTFLGLLFLSVITIPIFYTLSSTGMLEKESIPLDKERAKPEELLGIIKSQQLLYIKESSGEEEGHNFSAEDLAAFKASNQLQEINDKLQNDFYFREIVALAQVLPSKDFEILITNARKTRRPTWSELGQVSPKGQTIAGKEAETMIANSITNLFIKLVRTQ